MIHTTIQFVENIFKDNFDGHDAAHTMRVYKNAMSIASKEPCCDKMLVAMAALLHDVDDHKLFATEHNANARWFLAKQQVEPEQIEKICTIINGVSFSKNRGKRPETLEGQIVQDADRLDAMGAIGIARTFAYGGKHGRSIDNSLEHFHEKLLLLKDEMNTTEGKRLAQKRHQVMVEFLKELEEETC